MPRVLTLYVFAALSAVLVAVGCNEPKVDPAVIAQHRDRLELSEEPDGAQTVLEVRSAMYGIDPEAAADHENHDHDGDGVQDHAPEDHIDADEPASAGADEGGLHADDAHEGDEHAHEDHEHADHDHAADAGDDVEETDAAATAAHTDEEHADHDHAHEGEDAADHDHAAEDHDHDGDGVQDHSAEEHDAAMAAADAFTGKEPVVSEMDVVLVGSVGGVPNPSDQSHPEFPFTKGKAIFFLADPEAVAEMEEHAHVHAEGEECAFCAAHAGDSAHMLAVVQFTDEQGKTLAVDARDLFELKEKETVVVRGKAKVDPSGMLIVDATGLYVRR
jgi:hypothetical protein